jgi:transcription antitermination factor NusG
LFPGYLFCRFDPCRRLPILTTAGVVSIVSTSKLLLPVSEIEIEQVKKIVESGVTAEPWVGIPAGHRLSLESGPLRGIEGTLVRAKGRSHLVVSVVLLQRSVSVEIETDWARPISPLRSAAMREVAKSRNETGKACPAGTPQ